ncbi:MAG: FHA domain-containing protein [Deltaproteobacteria bacterium]|nr:FHA domain-containing protein [Deltaproteobacteria bacterium]
MPIPKPDPICGLDCAEKRALLLRGSLEIGTARGPGALALDGESIEPVHFAIRREPSGAYLLLHRAARGVTRVNGEPVEQRELRDGDVVGIGPVELVFRTGLGWDPDRGRRGLVSEPACEVPRSLEQLEAAMAPLPHRLRCLCALAASAEALPVWRAHAAGATLAYHDSVVGMHHVVDRDLPRRALAFVWACVGRGEFGPCFELARGFGEPVCALQDEDWLLPEAPRMAYYAAYNTFNLCTGWELASEKARVFAMAVHQAQVARIVERDLPREEARRHFDRWWGRCRSEWRLLREAGSGPPPGFEDAYRALLLA